MTKATATMMTGETVILATKVMVAKMESELGGDDNDGKIFRDTWLDGAV